MLSPLITYFSKEIQQIMRSKIYCDPWLTRIWIFQVMNRCLICDQISKINKDRFHPSISFHIIRNNKLKIVENALLSSIIQLKHYQKPDSFTFCYCTVTDQMHSKRNDLLSRTILLKYSQWFWPSGL